MQLGNTNKILDDVPNELYSMMRWIIAGPAQQLQTEVRGDIIDQAALTLSQNVMFGFKSKRQVFHKPKGDDACFRVQQQRENPQAIGLGLTVYQETRSKKLIDLLHYGRIL